MEDAPCSCTASGIKPSCPSAAEAEAAGVQTANAAPNAKHGKPTIQGNQEDIPAKAAARPFDVLLFMRAPFQKRFLFGGMDYSPLHLA